MTLNERGGRTEALVILGPPGNATASDNYGGCVFTSSWAGEALQFSALYQNFKSEPDILR